MKVERYNEYLRSIIKWNAIGFGEETDFPASTDRLALQRSVVYEELGETRRAIINRDTQEIIDGIADVLVTAGYLNYLVTGYTEASDELIDFDDSYVHDIKPTSLLTTIEMGCRAGCAPHHIIQHLIAWAYHQYGQDVVDSYIVAVLESNMSKFVPADEWSSVREIAAAYQKYGKKHDTVVGIRRDIGDETFYVLRASGGVGKILKPSTFVEPSALIHDQQ